jgi:deferrochelatase/peroxidase EfeB
MPEHSSSRRAFLLGSAATVSAAAAGLFAGTQIPQDSASEPQSDPAEQAPATIDFFGDHQAGIADPTPTHAAFLAFDAPPTTDRGALAAVMRRWTTLAAALATGDTSVDPTLVSAGSEPGMFTMTVGIGGAVLDRWGTPRPPGLVDLPLFPGDQIDPAASAGDVFVQLCSNDAVYLGGAVRAVRAAAAPALVARWQMNGFRGVAAASSSSNGRNLMGQIDGTNNIAVSRESTGAPVWVDAPTPPWMVGGSYVAVRRFRMLLNRWESAGPDIRDRAVGRHIASGAPLGSVNEADPVDLEATTATGAPLIPADAHIRLAAPRRDAGEEMLRRSYSYTNGQGAGAEEDAGLIFVSYQSDPRTSFIPVQQRLAESDALARFTVATSSALFAILPGVTDAGDWYGRALLG